ncbi:MAG: preprotein translocase subunit SecE [Lachnospiraceae bacterium]|nr:preprotein translocase subunit SecE [Lachnospiraceae bacterium]
MADEAKRVKGEDRGTSAAGGFFKGVRREFSRIMWPSREDIVKQTFAVVLLSVLLGVVISALDFGFSTLINLLAGIS